MDDISLSPSRNMSPKRRHHHRDVEEGGHCDEDRHAARNGNASSWNGRCDVAIGDCDDGHEHNPLLGGPIHANSYTNGNMNGTTTPCSNNNETISFREILPQDRIRIQALFEEWFPVEYKDEFYDHLCNHRTMGEQTLYTLVATVPQDGEDDDDKIIACLLGCKLNARKLNTASRVLLIPGYQPKNNNNKSNGMNSEQLADQALDELTTNEDKHENEKDNGDDESLQGTEVFYIMTLGVIEEYRKRGLASYLVERALQDQIVVAPEVGDANDESNELADVGEEEILYQEFEVSEIYQRNNNDYSNDSSEPLCETAYLHVIIQNQAAIRFYEKLGFERLREIADYYTIDEQKHNCYLYAKFFDKESVVERQERAKGLYSYYCYHYYSHRRRRSSPIGMVDFFHRTMMRLVTSIWSSVYWVLDGREGNRHSALAAAKNK